MTIGVNRSVADKDRIIEMAWEDRTSFEAIDIQYGLKQQDVIKLMRKEINKIRNNESDINPYGATSETEFFAVVSEYFFERPDLLQEQHPELYKLLSTIFRQQPTISS